MRVAAYHSLEKVVEVLLCTANSNRRLMGLTLIVSLTQSDTDNHWFVSVNSPWAYHSLEKMVEVLLCTANSNRRLMGLTLTLSLTQSDTGNHWLVSVNSPFVSYTVCDKPFSCKTW